MLLGVCLTASAVAGCASGGGSADCDAQIRSGNIVYTARGFTEIPAAKHGEAEVASCDDNGEDASGAYFPDDASRVTTWEFEGFSPDDVLGVRFEEGTLSVYVSDSVSLDERERLIKELATS